RQRNCPGEDDRLDPMDPTLRRAGRPKNSRRQRPQPEPLEERAVSVGGDPFAIGGDPIVRREDFRITTFASSLNYPTGLRPLADGSVLVGVNNPNAPATSFFNSSGAILRLVDANRDGVADGPGAVLFQGLPGSISSIVA